MAAPLFLGIELGTPALRATVVDAKGAVRAEASSAYETQAPQPGWSEQRPDDWWRACVEALGALRGRIEMHQVAAIRLSGQRGSVFLDGEREVIRPAILADDTRAQHEADDIERAVGIDRLVAITGRRASPGSAAAAMLWLRRNATIAYKRLHHVIAPKDDLRLRLTGELCTGETDAAATGLFDVRTRQWSAEIIDALDLDISVLPPLCDAPLTLRHEVAAELGLPADVHVLGAPVPSK